MLKSLLLLAATATLSSARYAVTLSPTLHTGPITADYLTPSPDQSDLDAPKLSHANASTFDWWTFDAIAIENPNVSLAVTFSTAGPVGYPLSLPNTTHIEPVPGNGSQSNNGALWAHIWATFEDGRRLSVAVPVETARMSGSGDSSIAIWHGGGGWMGSEEGYEVEIEVNRTEARDGLEPLRVLGRISYEKIAPSHSHCSIPNNFSTSLGLGEQGLGWVSVMPDAIASVDVDVNGTRLRFDGYGSHDKIWSNRPFTQTTKSLTRGRAHLGLHSISWLAYTPLHSPSSPNDIPPTLVSSSIARDGKPVTAGCASNSVTIEPSREQTEGGLVSGFAVSVPGARLSVATDVEERGGGGGAGREGGYVRWNGRARGTVGEGESAVDEEGVAMFERFEY
ncbi:hypothetical protein ASPCAL01535 [Aspergillus calidoustus]|uniref:AttH domain-containing protein n=1 Tax=Aspergillus calidoustus TaxID=454130 RepID=A0A0U5FTI7_ASPCI|nr:hypothetical protein ASPCAL01535 [Aspergillus calidoustus]